MIRAQKRYSTFSIKAQLALWVLLSGFVWYLSLVMFGWPEAFYRGTLILCSHILNFYVCYLYLIPYYFEHRQYGRAALGFIILLAVITITRYFIEQQFEPVPGAGAYRLVSNQGRLGFVLFSEIALAAFASLLRMAATREEDRQRVTELEKVQLETELKFLKMQMSPHFLFNTINNVYSLALVKSDKAPQALMKLSGLLRYLLYESHDKVSIQKEVEAIQAYVELFTLRHEKPVNISLQFDLPATDAKIEPLLIIPLLENALKHSGLGIVPEAFVALQLSANRQLLQVNITNSKHVVTQKVESGGIGLTNIQKRLQLTYSVSPMQINETDHQFNVLLTLPYS
jgi:hypothetical protein